MPDESAYELYFDEPRLRMTIGGRLLVRVVGFVSYLFLVAASATLLFSDVRGFRAAGFFLLLFLTDRFVHRRDADKHLTELPAGGRVNVAPYLMPRAALALEDAFQHSRISRSNFLVEIALTLLKHREIEEGIKRLGIQPAEFGEKLEEFLPAAKSGGRISREEIHAQAEALATKAFEGARRHKHRFVKPADLFSALSSVEDESVKRVFNIFSVDPGDLNLALLFSSGQVGFWGLRRRLTGMGGMSYESQRKMRHRIMNRAWTARPTPTLDNVATDLTDLSRRGDIGFLVGHESEYSRLVDALARPTNPNAILVGDAGVGKDTIISHLALNLAKDKVPPPLFDRRLVAIHLSELVAGAPPDELQKRLGRIVDEIYLAGNVILYIPDIHNLLKTSGTAYLSAADALMPIINNNAFPIIGTAPPKEFKEFLESHTDFTSNFEVIRVEEISEEEARELLVYESLIFEKQFGVVVSFGAVKEAVRLAKKYFREKRLPSSAEELLKDALAEANRRGEKILDVATVVRAAERKTNVPIHEAGEEESKTLLNLEAIVRERFIDQEEAVAAVSNALREYRSGLSRKGGPIATFLFVGPTGVGKTELSKTIAKIQFGSEDAMIRFDMSEYQDKQSFFRFIGSPDGSVSGALTDAVLKKPYSLVLLDEFEKAHADILNLFLQVFDDGRLTDNLGRVADFENTIIIATSNAHSEFIKEEIERGQTVPAIAEILKKKLTDYFKPELLNRFSRIIAFTSLPPEALEAVARLNLDDFAGILREQGIKLLFDPAVVKKIAELGYEPAFGARPLRQVIADKLRSPLAEKILKKEIVRGMDVKVVLEGSSFAFVASEASS